MCLHILHMPYVMLFWREFEECVQGGLGFLPGGSAWVSLYENTCLRCIEISFQMFRQPFCLYLGLMFRIHSLFIHILTPLPWFPAVRPFPRSLYAVNVKLSLLDCRWRHAKFHSHTVHLSDDALLRHHSDIAVQFVNIPTLRFTSEIFRRGQLYMLVDRKAPVLNKDGCIALS